MIVLAVVVTLAMLALVTQAGIFVLEREHPPEGRFVDVKGARLHVVELGPTYAPGLPVVLVHGASSSLQTMRKPLGDRLAKNHRVVLIDRPGHGWSTRERLEDSTPETQARMIDEALGKLGIDRAIIVGHSWAGALMPALALAYPKRVAAIMMLSPVAYPWPGGIGNFNRIAAVPVIGPLLAIRSPCRSAYFWSRAERVMSSRRRQCRTAMSRRRQCAWCCGRRFSSTMPEISRR